MLDLKQTDRMLRKLERFVDIIEPMIFEKVGEPGPVSAFATLERFHCIPEDSLFDPIEKGYKWGEEFGYCWFKTDFVVPDGLGGKDIFIRPHISGYEGTLWVDGVPYGNFSTKIVFTGHGNHYCDLLKKDAKAGEKIAIDLEYYAGHSYKGCHPTENNPLLTYDFSYEGIDICVKNYAIQEFYFDLRTLVQLVKNLPESSFRRASVINELEKVFKEIYQSPDDVDRDEFMAALERAKPYLKKALSVKNGDDAPKAALIGHSHMDTAWLWHVGETVKKCARTYANQLALMDEYPEYKFIQSSSCHSDFLRRKYPDLFARIQQKVKEGRYEPNGGVWVECDCNITSGESMVRQFLWGQRFTRKYFDFTSNCFWLPDTFGYSAAIPQIMKGCCVDYFLTTKIDWNDTNTFPLDTFYWEGIDGTKVFTHFNRTHIWPDAEDLMTYVAGTPSNSHSCIKDKRVTDTRVISYGYGDGGGGPTRDMLEMGHRMAKGIPGCPKVKQEFAIDFYHDLEKEVKGSRRLPKWAGELYLEFHRGTLTSQGRNKRYNRKSELLYHDMETICAIADSNGIASYPRQFINDGWKIILLNQFHDIIPGSSIKEVYEDSKEQYDKLISEGKAEIADTLGKIVCTPDGSALTVFNTFGAERDDVVITDMPADEHFSIVDADGNVMPWQKSADGRLVFFAKGVPAKGYKTFSIVHGGESGENTVKVENKTIENKFFTVKFDKDMNIASLIHKATGRSVAPEGEVLNKIYAYDDRPFNHEAWDIKVYFDQKYTEINDVSAVDVTESGPVRTVIKVTRKFLSSTIDQSFIFYADLPRIDVDYTVDWKEKKILLKADFPVDVNATEATYDIQFGNYKRPTHRNTLWDFAQFEVVGHKWVDLSDNSFGLSVLNDCKYGHDIKDGHIRTSLLRCAVNPNSEQDREVHRFTYSIYPHAGSVDTSDVVNQGYSLNLPLYCVSGKAAHDSYSLVSTDKDNVIIETVKKAEDSDDVVIRAYETWNKTTDCVYTFDRAPKSVYVCNLLEENEEQLEVSGNTVSLRFKPFEIKTVKVTF